MDQMINSVIQNLGALWSSGGGPEFWVKAALTVLLPLALIVLYWWGRREADRIADETARRESQEAEKKNRQDVQDQNNSQNSQTQIDSAASLSDKEKARTGLKSS